MRIQISSDLDKDDILDKIKDAQIVDDGDYLLIPKNRKVSAYDSEGIVFLELHAILYIASDKSNIYIYTENYKYISILKLYEYLDQSNNFIRISKSVIINKNKIRDIKPSMNMKFKVLIHETWLEVNRSYYYGFKDEMGI